MTLADDLVAGPRGRGLLMRFAFASEERLTPDSQHHRLWTADSDAPDRIETRPSRASRYVGHGTGGSGQPPVEETLSISPTEVAEFLAEVPLSDPTPDLLDGLLGSAVDNAVYWGPPPEEDEVAATGPVREQLRRIAEHVASAPAAVWWTRGVDRDTQWAVSRPGDGQMVTPEPLVQSLLAWRERTTEEERAMAAAGESGRGAWWSMPPFPVRATTGELADGSPAGLHFIEDSFGDRAMWAHRAELPHDARILEITGSAAWARLCREFPLEVTAQNREQWEECTGRSGRWVVPDYHAVARRYDAVHLTVSGYLSTAGDPVDVGEGRAGMLAGWNPDETYWLTGEARFSDAPVNWERGPDNGWHRRA